MSIHFRCNREKALQAILWLARERPGITRLQISKILFYADKIHLNLYGRPIIGDDYARLQYGPVPSFTLDIINSDALALESLELTELPFDVQGREVHPRQGCTPDIGVFSDSDIEALREAYNDNIDLGVSALIRKSHRESAWLDAPGHWMRYEDFLDPSDDKNEKIEDLTETSQRMVL